MNAVSFLHGEIVWVSTLPAHPPLATQDSSEGNKAVKWSNISLGQSRKEIWAQVKSSVLYQVKEELKSVL